MGNAKAPKSLRFQTAINAIERQDNQSAKAVSAVAGLIAVASFSGGAQAQDRTLPPVNVDAPVERQRPNATKPSADQVRARTAMRRAARRTQPAPVAAVPFPNVGGLRADRDPYADPAAPYKADRLQNSGKFPEPLLNTPKTVTVLTKEILEDKNATTLKQAVLSTAGVTLGTGEGGNAFGDRFFIRGFDARNDVFIDGMRDAGVSVRENFFTEQVEILRGPGSTFAGRGTVGGAINIVTKQATTDGSFYNMDTTLGSAHTKRVVLDVNQVISPTVAVRAGGLYQDAAMPGRDYATDDREGFFATGKWAPTDAIKVTGTYIHTFLSGIPDFGVPYYRPGSGPGVTQFATTAGGPFPDFGVNRNNFYGFVYRDFFKIRQDIGTANMELNLTPDLVLTNKTRLQRSSQDYIGTLPEAPNVQSPNSALWTVSANPQSRYQVNDNIANQTELVHKSNVFGWKNTMLAGLEISQEKSSIDKYAGLSSEGLPGVAGTPAGAVTGVNIFTPQFTFLRFNNTPTLAGLPTNIKLDTISGYVIDTANYNDFVILNGGVRVDDYNIRANGYGSVNNVPNIYGQQEQHYTMPNWNAGIVVKPLPIASVYAAYATSTNPVGAEFDGTSAQYGGLAPVLNGNATQIFGPEKNRGVEVGTKWELFDRHLLVTAALFQTEKENARESVNIANAGAATALCPYPTGTVGTVSCITAGAAYRIRGIDLGAGGKLTPKWSLFAGLVLMQSEVTKSLIPSPQPLLYASNVGRPLSNVAHQSFSALTKYQFNDMWELGGQAVYRSEIYGGTFLAANQGTSIPAYWRFDAFAEAKVSQNWRLKLFVNNIFDKRYYDALYQSATPFVLEAPGRTVAFVMSARY
jgi:catecholate siderophore receptor